MPWLTCDKCHSQIGHEHKTCICGNPLTFFKSKNKRKHNAENAENLKDEVIRGNEENEENKEGSKESSYRKTG